VVCVRRHVRRSIRGLPFGVRRYTRNLDVRLLRFDSSDPRVVRLARGIRREWLGRNPFVEGTSNYEEWERSGPNVVAFVHPDAPRTIMLIRAGPNTNSDDYAKVLSHETLHVSLSDVGERAASHALDTYPGQIGDQSRLPARLRLTRGGFKALPGQQHDA